MLLVALATRNSRSGGRFLPQRKDRQVWKSWGVPQPRSWIVSCVPHKLWRCAWAGRAADVGIKSGSGVSLMLHTSLGDSSKSPESKHICDALICPFTTDSIFYSLYKIHSCQISPSNIHLIPCVRCCWLTCPKCHTSTALTCGPAHIRVVPDLQFVHPRCLL